MIYTKTSLQTKFQNLANLHQKVSLEAKKGHLIKIKRGVYTDDLNQDKMALANFCYGPSYISFEYALSYYGLIPESVSTITSATFEKHHSKVFACENARFEYHDVPSAVFSLGTTTLLNEAPYGFRIATKEKALLDELYSKYQVTTFKSLKALLFEDLRIDEIEFNSLNKDEMIAVAPLYHSTTLNTLVKYLKKDK
jgi:predicted transcriptional regulator of viral defense system